MSLNMHLQLRIWIKRCKFSHLMAFTVSLFRLFNILLNSLKMCMSIHKIS